MKKILFAISFAFLLNLSASSYDTTTDILQDDFKVTLEWLEQKPKSYAKDFFIAQYLNQENLSMQDATTAFNMANEANANIKKIYNRKFKTIRKQICNC
jgi:soluble lytic murein transglycosylase